MSFASFMVNMMEGKDIPEEQDGRLYRQATTEDFATGESFRMMSVVPVDPPKHGSHFDYTKKAIRIVPFLRTGRKSTTAELFRALAAEWGNDGE